jgi:acylphosphatase
MSAGAPARICRRVRIDGRVQGVWYRGWTVEEALRRGLDGWVRNRADGSVEALFAGPEDVVEAMIVACHRGPPAAQVRCVVAETSTESPEPGFVQRATL